MRRENRARNAGGPARGLHAVGRHGAERPGSRDRARSPAPKAGATRTFQALDEEPIPVTGTARTQCPAFAPRGEGIILYNTAAGGAFVMLLRTSTSLLISLYSPQPRGTLRENSRTLPAQPPAAKFTAAGDTDERFH